MSDDVGEAIERAQMHFRNATREGLEALRALLEATQRASEASDTDFGSLTGDWKRSFDDWLSSLDPERISQLPKSLADALDAEIDRWEKRSQTDETARPVLRAFLGLRELLWELRMRSGREKDAGPDAPRAEPSTGTEAPAPSTSRRVQRFDIED